jgi:hypothetical protein
MTEDEFDELAAKCLMGEASPAEQAQLERLLDSSPARKEEFGELKSLSNSFRSIAPDPGRAEVAVPAFPKDRLPDLQAAVRRGISGSPSRILKLWLPMAAVIVALGVVALSILPRPGPMDDRQAVQFALNRSLKRVDQADLFVTMRSGPSIALYSPAQTTANQAPPILWRAEPGKTYDVLIRDQLNEKSPQWEARGVVPPLLFTNFAPKPVLKPGGLYKLRIVENVAGAIGSEYDLATRPDARIVAPAASSAEKIERARAALMNPSAPGFGDALGELLTLPSGDSRGELALRMKLVSYARLGLRVEYDQTKAELQRQLR